MISNDVIDNLSDVEDLYFAAKRVCEKWESSELQFAVQELDRHVKHFEKEYMSDDDME